MRSCLSVTINSSLVLRPLDMGEAAPAAAAAAARGCCTELITWSFRGQVLAADAWHALLPWKAPSCMPLTGSFSRRLCRGCR